MMGNSQEGTVWSMPAGVLSAATTKLWNELGTHGALVLSRLNEDNAFRKRVCDYMLLGIREDPSSTSQKRAREIMGRNIFGVGEAIRHFMVNITRQQFVPVPEFPFFEVPFTEATLEKCKDTHVLVAVFPISIIDIRGKVERTLFCDYDYEDSFHYNTQSFFANYRGKVGGWYLVRKTAVPGSTSKGWSDQQGLLRKNEETPTARVLIYTAIGHFLATGERLFNDCHVRCLDSTPSGGKICICFTASGLIIMSHLKAGPDAGIGISSARKPDTYGRPGPIELS